jgi:ribosomal protein S11
MDKLMKYEFYEKSKFNLEEYKQNLDGKIEYIKNINAKISNNTILLVTSDSGNFLNLNY